jgi:hypothetical protein
MSRRNSNSRKKRKSQRKAKHSSRPRSQNRAKNARRGLSPRQQVEKVRVLAALNRLRRGEARSVTVAARAEGTTLRAMRRLVPDTLVQDRPGTRIRVKPTDRYSAEVQVLTPEGALNVTARGSRQRELAGRHRAVVLRVLQGKEPPEALEPFRGNRIGGHELISDYEVLASFAHAGDVGQLEALYVTPDASV